MLAKKKEVSNNSFFSPNFVITKVDKYLWRRKAAVWSHWFPYVSPIDCQKLVPVIIFLQARLNTEQDGGAWCPVVRARPGEPRYLEIDLIEDYVISSVVTQGRYADGLGKEFASHFMLKFWRQGVV